MTDLIERKFCVTEPKISNATFPPKLKLSLEEQTLLFKK